MWRISSPANFELTRMMRKNERQTGETTGSKNSAGDSWICDTGFSIYVGTPKNNLISYMF
jgi:hypothetical protein